MAQLRQGTSPSKIAWTISAGMTIGVFPVPGTRAGICLLAGIVFRLNQPLLHTFKGLVYPLHLALIIPFIQAGQRVFGKQPLPLTIEGLEKMMGAGIVPFLQQSGWMLLRAAGVWLVVAPLVLLALHGLFTPLVHRLARRIRDGNPKSSGSGADPG